MRNCVTEIAYGVRDVYCQHQTSTTAELFDGVFLIINHEIWMQVYDQFR